MLLLLLQCEKILRHPFNNLRYLNRYVSQMTTILFSFFAKITVNDWHNTHLAFFPYLKQLNLGKMKFLMTKEQSFGGPRVAASFIRKGQLVLQNLR